MLKIIGNKYILGAKILLLLTVLSSIILHFSSTIGWVGMYLILILILIAQIIFYKFDKDSNNLIFTIFSFIINLVIWFFQVTFFISFAENIHIVDDPIFKIIIFTVGGFFWVSNKILIDLTIAFFKQKNVKNEISN